MTILKILQYPDLRLAKKAVTVDDVKKTEVQKLIDDMLETLAHLQNCAGLAATQLDVPIAWNVTVIAPTKEVPKTLCLVNPEILKSEGESAEDEGCMSVFPEHIHAKIKRAEIITFKALDRNGNKIEMTTGGFLAKCVQHEIDHLSGHLYIDRLSSLKLSMIKRKINKLKE